MISPISTYLGVPKDMEDPVYVFKDLTPFLGRKSATNLPGLRAKFGCPEAGCPYCRDACKRRFFSK